MEQKRKFPRWIIVLAVIVLVCAGVKVWYDRLCYGEIDISDSAPSKEMLLHILEHADELAAREDLFSVTVNDANYTTIRYIGNPDLEEALFSFFPSVADRLRKESTMLTVSSYYWRNNLSDFWDIVTPGSQLNLEFHIYEQVMVDFLFAVSDYDASAISDAPLREMMSAIESVIGTP